MAAELTFLSTRPALDQTLASSSRPTIVTADLAIANELEARSISFVDEWAFLDQADLKRNFDLSYEISAAWWGGPDNDFVHRGTSVCAAASGDLQFAIEAALNARLAYERLLDQHRPSSGRLFLEPPQAVCRLSGQPAAAMTSIAHGVLRWVCAGRGIPLELARAPAPVVQARQRPPRSTKSVAAFVSGTEPPRGATNGALLLLDLGQHPADMAELERALRQQGGWLTVRFSELNRPGYPRWFPPSAGVREAFDRSWRAYQSRRNGYQGPHPELFANPHLEFQFARIWDEMLAAIEVGDAVDAVLDAVQPSAVVLGVDTFTIERFAVARARAKGVPSAVLIHGGLGAFSAFRCLVSNADLTVVWGQEDVERLTLAGLAAERIARAGSMRYGAQWRSGRIESAGKEAARSQLSIEVRRPVIGVLTGATHLGYSVVGVDPPRHRATLRELVALARRRPEWTFLLKPHPTYDHFGLYRELARTGPGNLVLREDVTLGDVLPALDAALLVNLCTTAGLEAALAGVPIVFLRTAISDAWQRDSFTNHGAVNVADLATAEEALRRLLREPAHRQEALADAQHMLEHVLGPRDAEPSSSRVANAIVALALNPSNVPAPGRTDAVGLFEPNSGGPDWKALAERLRRSMPGELSPALFGTAFLAGNLSRGDVTSMFAELRALAQGQPRVEAELNKLLLSSALSAMIRATNDGDWHRVSVLFRGLLTGLPRVGVRSRLAWRLAAKALAAEFPLAAVAANAVEKGRLVVGRWS